MVGLAAMYVCTHTHTCIQIVVGLEVTYICTHTLNRFIIEPVHGRVGSYIGMHTHIILTYK